MTSYRERGFNSPREEAEFAFDSFSQGIAGGLAKAADRLMSFDTDLDTGSVAMLKDPQELAGFEGKTAISKKSLLVGVTNVEEIINRDVRSGTPKNILGVTLERDDETNGKQSPKILVRIGEQDGHYRMTTQQVDAENKVGQPSLTPLSQEQLQTEVVKGTVFKLGPEEAKAGKRLGIGGYHVTAVSSFSLKES